MPGEWVFGAITVLVLLHGMTLLYAFRRWTDAGAQEVFDGEASVTEDGVECPSCGTDNGTGFRYCRNCVSELPGQRSLLDRASSSRSRRPI